MTELTDATSHDRSVDKDLTLGQRMVIGGIRLYQLVLSPWIGRQCRFYPTCSHYTAQAVRLHGLARGLRLGVSRVGRCHPFHPGGVDLVPQPGKPPRSAQS